jgi:CubicO group peptidase (beta-lactamase class C family)
MTLRFLSRLALPLLLLSFALVQAEVFAQAPLPRASPESVRMSAARLHRIGQRFQEEIDKGVIPGAVAMVARRGRLVYMRALGKQDEKREMAEHSIFRIYSMTKPFVSVAAMILVEEGKLELTDPVAKYLPGWDKLKVSLETKDPATGAVSYTLADNAQPMRVYDLLRHTSGLVYWALTKNEPVREAYVKEGIHAEGKPGDGMDMSAAEQVERLARAPLAYQPGTAWHYGMSTDILGRVVEAASGQRLGDFLRERIFAPLRMNDTAFFIPPEKQLRAAEPFAKEPSTGKEIRLIAVKAPPQNDSGGAGAVSTAGDYLRFAQMLLYQGTLEGERIIGRPTLQFMTADHLTPDIAMAMDPGELLLRVKGYSFGLGFAVRKEDGLAGTPGSKGEFTWGGYAGTYFWVDPKEELAAVLMTQTEGAIRVHHRKLFRQLVYGAIMD